ncbi:MAG TPA: hypothetical protein VD930_03615 [Gemmatimonadales bacterium]|nr:hypothetical protein [Gemmatimonadales bacterium]
MERSTGADTADAKARELVAQFPTVDQMHEALIQAISSALRAAEAQGFAAARQECWDKHYVPRPGGWAHTGACLPNCTCTYSLALAPAPGKGGADGL